MLRRQLHKPQERYRSQQDHRLAMVSMTGDYTFVDAERQDETTRRIQQRIGKTEAKVVEIKRKETVA